MWDVTENRGLPNPNSLQPGPPDSMYVDMTLVSPLCKTRDTLTKALTELYVAMDDNTYSRPLLTNEQCSFRVGVSFSDQDLGFPTQKNMGEFFQTSFPVCGRH